MIYSQAASSNAITTSSNSQADKLRASKAFYDRVRSNFLRQSARYLRDCLHKDKAVSIPNNDKLVQLGIQQG